MSGSQPSGQGAETNIGTLRGDAAPTLCLIHEGIGSYNAIAKIVALTARIALDRGWKVTVVAKFLDKSLQPLVEWLPLFVPRRGFFVQWTTARYFIRQALGNRQFDVIYAHQPQVASLADIFHCHFLTRVAWERNCLESRRGFRPAMVRLQQSGVLRAEDYYYRRWNSETRMVFCSDLLRQEFHRLYGTPAREQVVVNPCPEVRFASPQERAAARVKLVGPDWQGPVIGYMGGLDERKGYKQWIHALEKEPELFGLMGGLHSENFTVPALGNRFRSIGIVYNPPEFYAACDAIIMPSIFDALGMVALEAAVCGTPVIATDGVGALSHLLKHSAGLKWEPGQQLTPLVQRAISEKEHFNRGARQLGEELSQQHFADSLMAMCDDVRRTKYEKPVA